MAAAAGLLRSRVVHFLHVQIGRNPEGGAVPAAGGVGLLRTSIGQDSDVRPASFYVSNRDTTDFKYSVHVGVPRSVFLESSKFSSDQPSGRS